MKLFSRCVFFSLTLLLNWPRLAAADLPALWAERTKSVVAVEYVTETEVDRNPTISMGTVIDNQGTVILPANAIDPRAATWQLKDFKVYLPGQANSTPGEYLGQDAFTGWHFVRVAEKIRGQLTPITTFAAKDETHRLALADFVWGIGLRNKDEDFMPYIMQSHLSLIQALPQRTGIAQQEVSGPGLPVFDRDGFFVGIAATSFGQSFLQFSRGNRGQPVLLINVEESGLHARGGSAAVSEPDSEKCFRPSARVVGRLRVGADGPRRGEVFQSRRTSGRSGERGARG